MSEASVSTFIASLKQGDQAAAEQLWVRYFERLVSLARQKLASFPNRAFDEEDVALSVFDSLCRGAGRGNFTRLADREDLWALLLVLTRQKIVDRKRHETRQKRGSGKVRTESAWGTAVDGTDVWGIEQLLSREPTPDSLVALEEQYRRLLALLPDDTWRRVAVLRMQGFAVKEIAAEFGYTTRWAERKLELIRAKWLRELQTAD